MTVDEVKRDLPKIKVRIEGTKIILEGHTAGRNLEFCKVWAYVPIQGGKLTMQVDWDFSWRTVTDHINNNTPLIFPTESIK